MARSSQHRLPLFTAFAWSFAVSGLLTVLGNIAGLGGRTWIFPEVDHLPGLLASSVLLFLVGMLPYAFRRARRPRPSRS